MLSPHALIYLMENLIISRLIMTVSGNIGLGKIIHYFGNIIDQASEGRCPGKEASELLLLRAELHQEQQDVRPAVPGGPLVRGDGRELQLEHPPHWHGRAHCRPEVL